jgi:hypothetical protein
MWPDDSGDWSSFGGSAAAAAPYSAPELPSGWSLTEGLKSAASTVTELFGAGFGVVSALDNFSYARDSRSLDLLERSAAIDINRTFTGAKIDIAKAQANAAVNAAKRGEAASGYDLSTILGNVNARIAGMSSGNSLMLWLTVAGVGIAALSFFKGRK